MQSECIFNVTEISFYLYFHNKLINDASYYHQLYKLKYIHYFKNAASFSTDLFVLLQM